MAITSIEWTATVTADGTLIPGYTFNPWTGCQKVSPACDNCYAEGWAKRSGLVKWGPGEDRRRTSASYWQQPLKWNRIAERDDVRRKVFCASLADVFDNAVPTKWRDDLWHLIAMTPHLDWLLLTKRPQNITKMLPDPRTGMPEWGDGWPNVWFGTTVENQEEADRRIPHLLAVPATNRFLSCEPLLGPINLTKLVGTSHQGTCHRNALIGETWHPGCGSDSSTTWRDGPRIDWVICGGESGPGARSMHPDWARSLRDQCRAVGVPFHFKQWGEWAPIPHEETMPGRPQMVRPGDAFVTISGARDEIGSDLSSALETASAVAMRRVGKKRAGAMLDGREWREMPR